MAESLPFGDDGFDLDNKPSAEDESVGPGGASADVPSPQKKAKDGELTVDQKAVAKMMEGSVKVETKHEGSPDETNPTGHNQTVSEDEMKEVQARLEASAQHASQFPQMYPSPGRNSGAGRNSGGDAQSAPVNSWAESGYGLFDCDCFGEDSEICLFSFIIPPYRWATTVSKARGTSFAPWFIFSFLAWVGVMWAYPFGYRTGKNFIFGIGAFCNFVILCLGAHNRQIILERGRGSNIESDCCCCDDCCVYMFCPCCAVAQEARWIESEEVRRVLAAQPAQEAI